LTNGHKWPCVKLYGQVQALSIGRLVDALIDVPATLFQTAEEAPPSVAHGLMPVVNGVQLCRFQVTNGL
ncbi:hypothetical protein, partial [Asticcacaulis benevestitus]|uniref:hypothetical protein n=1 Tax=Asticcacaulis benevestitus TaxID=347481 RepID=UPI001F34D00A